jgi:hypothetical protein
MRPHPLFGRLADVSFKLRLKSARSCLYVSLDIVSVGNVNQMPSDTKSHASFTDDLNRENLAAQFAA